MADYMKKKKKKGELLNCISFTVLYPNIESKNIDASRVYEMQSLEELEQLLISLIPLKQQYLKEYLEQQ